MLDIPSMHDFLTPMEYFEYLASPQGLKGKELENRSIELLEAVGLLHAKSKRIKGFSRGMRQRMGIAAGLITNPPIVIMDEPSSALDPQGRYEVTEVIKKLAKQGKTIILSTHILTDVEKVCSRIGLLVNGNLIIEGTLKEVFERFNENAFRIICDKSDYEKIKKAAYNNKEAFEKYEENEGELIVYFNEGYKEEMMKTITATGVNIDSIILKRPSMEEIFLATNPATIASNGEVESDSQLAALEKENEIKKLKTELNEIENASLLVNELSTNVDEKIKQKKLEEFEKEFGAINKVEKNKIQNNEEDLKPNNLEIVDDEDEVEIIPDHTETLNDDGTEISLIDEKIDLPEIEEDEESEIDLSGLKKINKEIENDINTKQIVELDPINKVYEINTTSKIDDKELFEKMKAANKAGDNSFEKGESLQFAEKPQGEKNQFVEKKQNEKPKSKVINAPKIKRQIDSPLLNNPTSKKVNNAKASLDLPTSKKLSGTKLDEIKTSGKTATSSKSGNQVKPTTSKPRAKKPSLIGDVDIDLTRKDLIGSNYKTTAKTIKESKNSKPSRPR
jgi:ABC-2 type transport system ATP-binding protein